jgi:hypothetical protein
MLVGFFIILPPPDYRSNTSEKAAFVPTQIPRHKFSYLYALAVYSSISENKCVLSIRTSDESPDDPKNRAKGKPLPRYDDTRPNYSHYTITEKEF